MLSMRYAPLVALCLQLTEHQHAVQGCKKFGIILAFDVPVTREAQELADKEGVRIMRADIIYHLFDQFTAYCKEVGCRGDERDAPCCTSMSQVFIRADFCRSRSMSRRLQSWRLCFLASSGFCRPVYSIRRTQSLWEPILLKALQRYASACSPW